MCLNKWCSWNIGRLRLSINMHRTGLILGVLLLLSSICIATFDLTSVAQLDEISMRKSLQQFAKRAEICSSTPVSKVEQIILGHKDVTLPAFTSQLMPTHWVESETTCVSSIWRDWFVAHQKTEIHQDQNIFTFVLKEEDKKDVSWKIEQLKNPTSQLLTFRIREHSQDQPADAKVDTFFAKLYPFPEGSDAFHAELLSSQAMSQLTGVTYFEPITPLLIRRCVVGENQDLAYYVTLTRAAKGKPLHKFLRAVGEDKSKNAIDTAYRTVFLSFRALGELHAKSSQLYANATAQLFFPSELPIADYAQTYIAMRYPDFNKKVMRIFVRALEGLLKSVKENPEGGVIPSGATYVHYDASTTNIFVDEEKNYVTIIDLASMYVSLINPSAEDRACPFYLTNPLQPLKPRGHPAFDYFFLLSYIQIEATELIREGALTEIEKFMRSGYCAGWFSHDKEKLEECFGSPSLWNENTENFFKQLTTTLLAPENVMAAFEKVLLEQHSYLKENNPPPAKEEL